VAINIDFNNCCIKLPGGDIPYNWKMRRILYILYPNGISIHESHLKSHSVDCLIGLLRRLDIKSAEYLNEVI